MSVDVPSDAEVLAVGPRQLRERLLQLNDPAIAWLIRDGSPDGVDLIVEWKTDDPDWRQVLEDLEVPLSYQMHLHLDPDTRELLFHDRLVQWRRDIDDRWVECCDTGDLHLVWSGNSNCRHYLISVEHIKVAIWQCVHDVGWDYRVSG